MKSKAKKLLQIMVPCIAFVFLIITVIWEVEIKSVKTSFGNFNGLVAMFFVIPTAYFLLGYPLIALCKSERIKHIVLFLAVFPISFLCFILWELRYQNGIVYTDWMWEGIYVLFVLLISTMNIIFVNALLFMPKSEKRKKE